MIEIFVDGQSVDVDERVKVAISLGIANVENPAESSDGYSKSIELPMTNRNRRVFRHTDEFFSKEQFNNSPHTAEVRHNGVVVISGVVVLNSYVSNNSGGGVFKINILGSSIEWVKSAQKRVNELKHPQEVKYLLEDVYRNSVNGRTDELIKFCPVDRGAYFTKRGDELVPRTELDLYDYHPFINVWQLLLLVFEGYQIVTSMAKTLGGLYLSAYMPKLEDVNYLKEENDFELGTTYDETRSFKITPTKNEAEFINIYDDELENENGVISMTHTLWGLCTYFTPTDNIKIGFDCTLLYSTTVTAANEEGINGRLVFVDHFYFGRVMSSEGPVESDREQLVMFSPKDSNEWKEAAATGDSDGKLLDDFPNFLIEAVKDAVLLFKLTDLNRFSKLIYEMREITTGKIIKYDMLSNFSSSGDWLLFRGYATISIAPHRVYLIDYYGKEWDLSKSENKSLYTVEGLGMLNSSLLPDYVLSFRYEGSISSYAIPKGALFSLACGFDTTLRPLSETNAVTFRVLSECNLRPNFRDAIGYGENVSISTIGGTKTQLEVVQAIRQMYNLLFYTNPVTREVFIEPRTNFYTPYDQSIYAGEQMTLRINAEHLQSDYNVEEYDFVVRVGAARLGLVGYTDPTRVSDFSVRVSGSVIEAIVPPHKSAQLPSAKLEVGLAMIRKSTGTVEIDQVVTDVELGSVVDWSHKMDYSQSIEIEELGMDVGGRLLLGYAEGDEVQKKHNRKIGRELGTYSVGIAKEVVADEKEIRNPLFAPAVVRSIDSMGFERGVVQNVVESEKNLISDVELDVNPVVVQYVGEAKRGAGSDIAEMPSYPLLAFQDVESGVNIGFEGLLVEEGELSGLSRYYQDNIDLYNRGRRITAHIKLEAKDIEPIIAPNSQKRDLRALIKLKLYGESIYCRLEQIVDYNPQSGGSTKCLFIEELRR